MIKKINIIRKIIVIPIAIIHLLINSITIFIFVLLFFGLEKANNYMDNLALNWIELFSN